MGNQRVDALDLRVEEVVAGPFVYAGMPRDS
jgi:hypothetical protein